MHRIDVFAKCSRVRSYMHCLTDNKADYVCKDVISLAVGFFRAVKAGHGICNGEQAAGSVEHAALNAKTKLVLKTAVLDMKGNSYVVPWANVCVPLSG